MERKLASVQRIAEIKSIEGADAIEAARVNGWWVVVKKSEFVVGDLVIYFEIDSWVPTELAPFLSKGHEPREYNNVKGERLRTVKLRGQVSQGLILPLKGVVTTEWAMDEGDDLSEYLNVNKWDPPVNAQLAGLARGNFPSFIPKTDQERCQNLVRELSESFESGDMYEVTVKMDGSSGTYYVNNGVVGVCSRNLDLKVDESNMDNTFVKLLYQTGLNEVLPLLGFNVAIQGEVMGEGVQGNREGLQGHQLYIFDIFDIDQQRYMTPFDRQATLGMLKVFGYTGDHVPVLETCTKLPSDKVSELLEYAEGKSLNNPVREGVVFKRIDGEFSFKAISNKFLLSEK